VLVFGETGTNHEEDDQQEQDIDHAGQIDRGKFVGVRCFQWHDMAPRLAPVVSPAVVDR